MGKLWSTLPGKGPVKLLSLLGVVIVVIVLGKWIARNPGSIGDFINKFFTEYLPAAVDWFISLFNHASKG
jgi:hypothetical protein